MSFSFILDIKDLILNFVSSVLAIFNTSIGDLLGDLSYGFLPVEMLDLTLMDFIFTGGISFIICYTIVKWLVPFLE